MKVNQRDVVFLNYLLPNGQFKPHPAVIVSTDELYEAEGVYYAVMLSTKAQNPDFMVTLTPDAFNYPTDTTSFAKCHLVSIPIVIDQGIPMQFAQLWIT